MALSPASQATFPFAALSFEPSGSPSASQATSSAWRRVVSNPLGSSASRSWVIFSSSWIAAGSSRRFHRSSQAAIQSAEAPGRSCGLGPGGTMSGGICGAGGESAGRGGPGAWPCADAAKAAASTAMALRHTTPNGDLPGEPSAPITGPRARATVGVHCAPEAAYAVVRDAKRGGGGRHGEPARRAGRDGRGSEVRREARRRARRAADRDRRPGGPAPLAPPGGGARRSAVGQVADVPDVVWLQRADAGEAHRRAVGGLDQIESLAGRAVDGRPRPVDLDAEELEAGGPRVQLDLLGNADHGGQPAQRAAGVGAADAGGQPLEGGGHLHVAAPGHLTVAEALAVGRAVRHAQSDRRGARAAGLAGLLRRRLIAASLTGRIRADPRIVRPVREADDGGHLHFLEAAVGVAAGAKEVHVAGHRLERGDPAPVRSRLLRALVDHVSLPVLHQHGEPLRGVGTVLCVGEEGDHDLRPVAQEPGRGVAQRHPHRLQPLRLARAARPGLHVARDPSAERGGIRRAASQHRARVAGRHPELARLGREAAQAGGGRARVPGRPPVAVALRGGVGVPVGSAGAESLEDGGGHHGDLVVDRRDEAVQLGGETGQRLREPILLAGHRKGVVDHEEDVGLGGDLDLAVLRHGDECRRLHRNCDVALAGHSRDEQREKGYNCPEAHRPSSLPRGGFLRGQAGDGEEARQGCDGPPGRQRMQCICQGASGGYIGRSPLDTENDFAHSRRDLAMSEKGKVVTPAAPGLINKEDIPQVLPILPLRNSVFFPGGVLPLAVGRQKTIALIKDAVRDDQVIGVVTQRKAEEEDPGAADLHQMGTVARIVKLLKMGEDNYSLVVQGLARFRVVELVQEHPYLKARIEPVEDKTPNEEVEVEALGINLKKLAREVIEMMPELPAAATELVESITQPGHLADLIAANVDVPIEEKQQVLETVDLKERMKLVLELLNRKREILKLSSKIDSQVKGEMSKTQREYYLRQQLKAIKEELGELGEEEEELDELGERLKKIGLPPEVEKVANKELNRLKSIPTASSEYLAVRKLKNDMKGPILCLVGPPGVGKTSLGQSIARATNRKFVRLSLGGVRDEAEIRGHRRTYVGALPGRIIQSMKKAGTVNPVMMLDEIDKLGADFRGDPSAALLEVLDPEQNNSFSDHYLDVPYDLSKIMFIATANQLDPIPPPLRDRMEVIELPGYTFEEKIHIAKNHLIPKQVNEHGLSVENLELSDAALTKIIVGYTREAGVRNMERTIADVCRAVAVDVAKGSDAKRVITAEELEIILGPEKFWSETAERTEVPGVATGLAWTSAGGDLLFIEATKMQGKGGITLTGQLGDVMKESAQAALSYTRNKAQKLGIDPRFLEKNDIHIHFPAGAIPKDGPSAGVTIFTALTSLLAGIKRIILPERNKKDLQDVPEQAKKEMEFVFAHSMDDVLKSALEEDPFEKAAKNPPPPEVQPPPTEQPQPGVRA